MEYLKGGNEMLYFVSCLVSKEGRKIDWVNCVAETEERIENDQNLMRLYEAIKMEIIQLEEERYPYIEFDVYDIPFIAVNPL